MMVISWVPEGVSILATRRNNGSACPWIQHSRELRGYYPSICPVVDAAICLMASGILAKSFFWATIDR